MQAGAVGYDLGISIDLDSSGNIYTSGYFLSTVDFDPGPGTFNLTSAGSNDIFVVKIADAPTGISDNVMGLLPVTIYPNPSKENIIVNLNESIRSGVIEIISPDSKIVFKDAVKSETGKNIRVENLQSGIYFVRVITGDKIFSQKIIIQ
jgi:hypothetical protein